MGAGGLNEAKSFDGVWEGVAQALQQGEAEVGAQQARELLQIDADNARGWFLLGVAEQMLARYAAAESAYRRSLALTPTVFAVHLNLARVCAEQGRLSEAEAELAPFIDSYAEALLWRARLRAQAARWPEAIADFQELLNAAPEELALRREYWTVLLRSGRLAAAVTDVEYWRWRATGAEQADRLTALAYAQAMWECPTDRGQESLSCMDDTTLEQGAWSTYWLAAADLHRGAAPAVVQRLLPWLQQPDLPEEAAHEIGSVFGAAALAMGYWREGWLGFSLGRNEMLPPQLASIPVWQGEALTGKTLLVQQEAELSDTITALRYLPLLRGHGASLIGDLTPDIMNLCRASGMPIAAAALEQPTADYRIRLMDLPAIVAEQEPCCPDSIPYLRSNAADFSRWQARLPAGPVRMALAWAGGPTQANDLARSTALSDWLSILAVPGIVWLPLQKGAGAAEAEQLPNGSFWQDRTADVQGTSDTAAVLDQCDLLLTVDAEVAHLAGAMARPGWVLLGASGVDWRWGVEGDASAWYPSLRLWRRPAEQTRTDYIAQHMVPALARYMLEHYVHRLSYVQRQAIEALLDTAVQLPESVLSALLEDDGGQEQWWHWLDYLGVVQKRCLATELATLRQSPLPAVRALALRIALRQGDKAAFAPLLAEAQQMALPLACYPVLADEMARLGVIAKLDTVLVHVGKMTDIRIIYLRAAAASQQLSGPQEVRNLLGRVLELAPRHVGAMWRIAELDEKYGRHEQALYWLSRALQVQPRQVFLWESVTRVALKQGARELAQLAATRGLQLDANQLLPALALKTASESADPVLQQQAEALLAVALTQEPTTLAEFRRLLVNALFSWQDIPLSSLLEQFREQETYLTDLDWVCGWYYLIRGQYRLGWPGYMTRKASYRVAGKDRRDCAQLSKILVYQDQGMGDVIQAVRMLPELVNETKITVAVGGDVLPLLQAQPWPIQWQHSKDLDTLALEFEHTAPIMQLYAQRCFDRGALDAVELKSAAYLQVPSELQEVWRQRLQQVSGYKIGIIWAGSATYVSDHFRSTLLRDWLPLADVPGISLISLQKDAASAQVFAVPELELSVAAADCNTLLDTAGLLMNLELLITVDSGVAHLAGALGRPVWVLLPIWATDWRWGQAGDSTQLYPSMRLWRQKVGQSWRDVLTEVAAELRKVYGAGGRHEGI